MKALALLPFWKRGSRESLRFPATDFSIGGWLDEDTIVLSPDVEAIAEMSSFPIKPGSGAQYLPSVAVMPTGGSGSIRDISSNYWFSPLQPVKPVAPKDLRPRQWQYQPGANIIWQPGASDTPSAGFELLRLVADNWDLLRIVIETVKDRICAAQWEVRLIQEPGKKRKDTEEASETDKDVLAVKQFLLSPDGIHDWESWLRMWLEDVLVLDAGAIYHERDLKGRIASLRPIDGGTINRALTEQGFTPQGKGDVAYQQVLYGLPAINLTTDDLTYVMRNPRTWKRYGFGPVEQILVTINIGLSRQKFTLNYYAEGNIPEGLVFLPPTVPPNQVLEVQQWFDSMLAGDLQRRRRINFLPGFGDGKTDRPNIVFPKEPLLKDEMDEWLFKVICYSLGTTPQNMIKQMNRASAESGAESAEEEGLGPKLNTIASVMNSIIQKQMGYTNIEFSYEQRREVDALKQAQIDKIYADTGVVTRNEIRSDIGKDELDMPEMDEPGLLSPQSGFIPLTGGQLEMPGTGSGAGAAGKLAEEAKQTASDKADEQVKEQNKNKQKPGGGSPGDDGGDDEGASDRARSRAKKKAYVNGHDTTGPWAACARHEFYHSGCLPCAKTELYRVQVLVHAQRETRLNGAAKT
jgi:Phage portal protein